MEPIVLTDKSTEPTTEIIYSYISENRIFWDQLLTHLDKENLIGEWKYYNDGKSWLFRCLKKDKVVFWGAVFDGGFYITFYLSSKAEPLIEASDLPNDIKLGFEGTRGQKFRAISQKIDSEEKVENVKKLIGIKLKVK